MSPQSPAKPRRRQRVSAEHTLERVRNNQRRHRARRREYIAELEEKVDEMSQTISSLEGKVKSLQDELARCDNHDHNHDQDDVANVDTTAAPPSRQLQQGGIEPGSESPVASTNTDPYLDEDEEEPEPVDDPPVGNLPDRPANERGSSATNNEYQNNSCCQNLKDRACPDPEEQILEDVPGPCVSAAGPSQAGAPCPPFPAYLLRPEFEAQYQQNSEDESTVLCSEAFLLISQQNYKSLSQDEVASWLWSGFRRALRPGEGCRVRSDLLLGLLTYISDV